MVIEVQAPLFVFREWHRHRTQSYNEMSARYTALPELYYHCHVDQIIERARVTTTNKQASGNAVVNETAIMDWAARDLEIQDMLEQHYQVGLAIGVPKELARKKMPVDHYSKMRAAANLRNWLSFMTLRCTLNAQFEIREYAWAVAEIIEAKFPQTYRLWADQEKQRVERPS
jgi:thymidylate synthase (FAD)